MKRVRYQFDLMGIDHRHAIVLYEKGLRGDLEEESREVFNQLLGLVRAKRVRTLGVDQQSRFSRGCNAAELISDVVYYGGRFVTADGVDTDRSGWEELVGIKSIQSRMELKDIGHRVRRQQEHLAEDPDGCVGNQPYGYSSEYRDPLAAAAYCGRGPKPRKRVIIDRPTAAVVRMVFIWFAIKGVSITKLVRQLNALGRSIPPIPSKKWRGWQYYHVRRMLSQRKYIGDWEFGGTTTVRSGRGKKRQVPKKKEQREVHTQRPHLRLIPQGTWDAAQEKLRKLQETYGVKEGGLRRGTPVHYSLLYPKSLLQGLVVCGLCGKPLHTGGNGKRKHLYCSFHRTGGCAMATTVPFAKATNAVLAILGEVLSAYPPWVSAAVEHMSDAVKAAQRSMPAELEAKQARLVSAQQDVKNLLAFIFAHRTRRRSRRLAG